MDSDEINLNLRGVTIEKLRSGSTLLFDKPLNWTSFDLVNKVRRIIRRATGERRIKVGHAGTLDPLATGLMILCTGRATKSISGFTSLDKEYVATIKVGETTPSYDLETEIDKSYPTDHISEEKIAGILPLFIGEQTQVPPAYSAKYIDGVRAYELARSGEAREPRPVTVNISQIEMVDFTDRLLKIRVLCSKGTYIRSLARDIGRALDSGAHLVGLIRTKIGDYKLDEAVTPDYFEKFVDLLQQNGDGFV